MTALVIVESPAKAKTISRFLGEGYRVEASYGHVRDLPEKADEIPEEVKKEKWARFGVNIEEDFQPVYVIPASKKKQVDLLRKALRESDSLLLATDEDREGESISWHLLAVLNPKKNLPIQRIVFHEITPEAIKEALAHPRQVDERLVQAQESRRILDRLYGYSLSPVLWKKVQSGLSAGRVQSVALRLIVEREEERKIFVPSTWWDLEAQFEGAGTSFGASLVRIGDKRLATGKDFDSTTGKLRNESQVELLDEKLARGLAQQIGNRFPWVVTRVEEKPATQSPAPPFTTSTLQQEANRKLGFPADRTMRTAQSLYEGIDLGGRERVGLITYMRTDSVTLSERALGEAQKQILQMYGRDYATGARRYRTKSRSAQEAHEAIRPTDLGRTPQQVEQYLSREEFVIYDLVWKRTIASQMPDAQLLRTNVDVTAKTEKGTPAVFTASGKKILFPGFLRAYVEGSDDPAAEIGDRETVLPDLRQGQEISRTSAVALKKLEAKDHTTTPPPRYTDASLVKKLEDEGIGRPSTYASIISTIQARGYVVKRGKYLVPTFTAMAVIDLMRRHFGEYVDYKFTARMEEELDEIAEGNMEWKDHVRRFYRGGNGLGRGAGHAEGLEKLIAREQEKIEFPALVLGNDPETGEAVTVRVGRFGPYVTRGEGGEGKIATVPQEVAPADFTMEEALRLIARRAEGPREVGTHPETGQRIYAARGRFGAYVQLGETPEEKGAEKPRRASLPKGMTEDEVDIGTALRLLSLPRALGAHPESGQPVIVNIGRFGPYVQHGTDFRSLKKEDDPYEIGFDRAMELLAAPKAQRGASSKEVLKEVGKTEDGRTIRVMSGQYGPYVSDGKTNATLPKDKEPDSVTMAEAADLLEARAKKPAAKKGGRKAAKKSKK